MPRITMATEHALGSDEAVRRLKEKFSFARDTYGSQVSDLREEWDGHILSFGFKSMGMKVEGTVTVEDSQAKLDAKIPLAAMIFRGAIEKQIREELGDLLA